MRHLAIPGLLALIGSMCCVVANTTACTKEQGQQVENIVPSATVCVEDVIADLQGAIDIPGTLAHCSITAEQLIAYLEGYFASDGGALGASPAKVQRAGKLLDAARTYKKAHTP